MKKCSDNCPVHNKQLCCKTCPSMIHCDQRCDYVDAANCPMMIDDGVALTAVEEKALAIMQGIKNLVIQKKSLEVQEKNMKEQLKAVMEQAGVKKFDNPLLSVTYIAATTSVSLDSSKVKQKYPGVYAECCKEVSKGAYIKVEVKED